MRSPHRTSSFIQHISLASPSTFPLNLSLITLCSGCPVHSVKMYIWILILRRSTFDASYPRLLYNTQMLANDPHPPTPSKSNQRRLIYKSTPLRRDFRNRCPMSPMPANSSHNACHHPISRFWCTKPAALPMRNLMMFLRADDILALEETSS